MAKLDWRAECIGHAVDMVLEGCLEEIVEGLLNDGKASSYVSDYESADQHLHESVLDDCIDGVTEAAHFLDRYWNERETDRGLWEGQEPAEALVTQATYTYGNIVTNYFGQLVKEINGDAELAALLSPDPEESIGGCVPSRVGQVNEDAVRARVRQICEEFP